MKLDWRLAIIQVGALMAFALIPVWYRLPTRPPLLDNLYVARFLILLPLLWTIAAWLVLGMPGFKALRQGDRWRRFWALALLALALWGLLSTQWAFIRASHPEVGATAAVQFAVAALFVVVVACIRLPPRAVVAVLTFSLIWNGALTMLQTYNQAALGLRALGEFPFNAEMQGVSIIRAGDLLYVRPYGLMSHPNVVAGTLLVSLLASAAWIFHRRTWVRIAGGFAFAFGLTALLLTFSRAAWVGLAAGLVAALPLLRGYLFARRYRWTTALVLGLALMIGVVFFLQYRPFLAARAGEGQESIELRSVSDRIVFTQFALRSIAERPIFGVGIGNFPWRTSYYLVETFYDLRGDNVHHVLLSAAAELGIPGLLLLLSAMVCGVIAAFRMIAPQRAPRMQRISLFSLRSFALSAVKSDPYRVALLAIFVALTAIGLFDHYPWTILHFQVAWWGCLGAALSRS